MAMAGPVPQLPDGMHLFFGQQAPPCQRPWLSVFSRVSILYSAAVPAALHSMAGTGAPVATNALLPTTSALLT